MTVISKIVVYLIFFIQLTNIFLFNTFILIKRILLRHC